MSVEERWLGEVLKQIEEEGEDVVGVQDGKGSGWFSMWSVRDGHAVRCKAPCPGESHKVKVKGQPYVSARGSLRLFVLTE